MNFAALIAAWQTTLYVNAIALHPTRIASITGYNIHGASESDNVNSDYDAGTGTYQNPQSQRYGAYAAWCAALAGDPTLYTPYALQLLWEANLQNPDGSFQGNTNDVYHNQQLYVNALAWGLAAAYGTGIDPILGAGQTGAPGSWCVTYLPVFKLALQYMLTQIFTAQVNSLTSYGDYGHRRWLDMFSIDVYQAITGDTTTYANQYNILAQQAGAFITKTPPFPGAANNATPAGYLQAVIPPIANINQPGVFFANGAAIPAGYVPGQIFYVGGCDTEGAGNTVPGGFDITYSLEAERNACGSQLINPAAWKAAIIAQMSFVAESRFYASGMANPLGSTRTGVSDEVDGTQKTIDYGTIVMARNLAKSVLDRPDIYAGDALTCQNQGWIASGTAPSYVYTPTSPITPPNPPTYVTAASTGVPGEYLLTAVPPGSNKPSANYQAYVEQPDGSWVLAQQTPNVSTFTMLLRGLPLGVSPTIAVYSQSARARSTTGTTIKPPPVAANPPKVLPPNFTPAGIVWTALPSFVTRQRPSQTRDKYGAVIFDFSNPIVPDQLIQVLLYARITRSGRNEQMMWPEGVAQKLSHILLCNYTTMPLPEPPATDLLMLDQIVDSKGRCYRLLAVIDDSGRKNHLIAALQTLSPTGDLGI